jgi:transcription elongation factor Elf1
MQSPEGFERATGVVESTFTCDECGQSFRSVATSSRGEVKCTKCHSYDTHPMIAAQQQATATVRTPPAAR